jgi:hypothetical protein
MEDNFIYLPDDLTFKAFSTSVPDNISKVIEKCYRNNYIAFLFVTLKTSSNLNTVPIIYFPFQTTTYAIPFTIPTSSTGQFDIPNDFIYGYSMQDYILAYSGDNKSRWLHLSLVLAIL